MIAKLKGRVDQIGEDFAVIDVGGVGYLVFAGSRTLAALAVGEAAEIAIETHVREDHIHLYGFATAAERVWFKTLTTVQGVGVKMAMAILSSLSPEQILTAIIRSDKTKALGVIEPFYGTCCHNTSFKYKLITRAEKARKLCKATFLNLPTSY